MTIRKRLPGLRSQDAQPVADRVVDDLLERYDIADDEPLFEAFARGAEWALIEIAAQLIEAGFPIVIEDAPEEEAPCP